jgi:predicted RNA-binding protein with PIN domain
MADLPRQLLIDGWNVLHALPVTSGVLRREGPAVATALLLARLRSLGDLPGWRVCVVWDSKVAKLMTDASADSGILQVFAPASRSADSIIEELVARSAPGTCVVVTHDAAERALAAASGAELMRPDDLLAWMDRLEQRLGRHLGKPSRPKLGGTSLGDAFEKIGL